MVKPAAGSKSHAGGAARTGGSSIKGRGAAGGRAGAAERHGPGSLARFGGPAVTVVHRATGTLGQFLSGFDAAALTKEDNDDEMTAQQQEQDQQAEHGNGADGQPTTTQTLSVVVPASGMAHHHGHKSGDSSTHGTVTPAHYNASAAATPAAVAAHAGKKGAKWPIHTHHTHTFPTYEYPPIPRLDSIDSVFVRPHAKPRTRHLEGSSSVPNLHGTKHVQAASKHTQSAAEIPPLQLPSVSGRVGPAGCLSPEGYDAHVGIVKYSDVDANGAIIAVPGTDQYAKTAKGRLFQQYRKMRTQRTSTVDSAVVQEAAEKSRPFSSPIHSSSPPPKSNARAQTAAPHGKLAGAKSPGVKKLPPLDDLSRDPLQPLEEEQDGAASARDNYLRACRDSHCPPEPLIVRRLGVSDVLDLSHYSIGDRMGQCLAAGLSSLPGTRQVIMTDNRFSDGVTCAIVKAVANIRPWAGQSNYMLQVLRLDENKVGALCCAALGDTLLWCTGLVELHLRKCGLTDDGLKLLSKMLRKNYTLKVLDVASNKVTTTGLRELADALQFNETVEHLDIAWNGAQAAGAAYLARTFAEGYCPLKHLDISWNGIGDLGAQEMGHMIQKLTSLTHLNLSNNAIRGAGAVVVAHAMSLSPHVTELLFSGNPIGRVGARAFIMALGDHRSRSAADVQMSQCTFESSPTEENLFNPAEPNGQHVLYLGKAYDRTVVTEILKLVTDNPQTRLVDVVFTHPSGVLVPLTVSQRRTRLSRPRALWRHLRRNLSDLLDYMMEIGTRFHSSGTAGTPKHGAAAAPKLAGIVDAELDERTSAGRRGSIVQSTYGLGRLATNEGPVDSSWFIVDASRPVVEAPQEATGAIGNETTQAFREAATKEARALARSFVPNSTFHVPSYGVLSMLIETEQSIPSKEDLSRFDITKLLTMIDSDKFSMRDREAMLRLATTELYLSTEQADAILRCAFVKRGGSADRIATVKRILYRLVDSAGAVGFLKRNLTKSELKAVQRQLGPAYRVLVGLPCGHFAFDLASAMDRYDAHSNTTRCLNVVHHSDLVLRLAGMSGKERKTMQERYGLKFDTSQHGNGEGFRNETLDKAPIVITASNVTTLPKEGILEFDYMSFVRPARRTPIVTGLELAEMRRTSRLVQIEEMAAMEMDSIVPPHAPTTVVSWNQNPLVQRTTDGGGGYGFEDDIMPTLDALRANAASKAQAPGQAQAAAPPGRRQPAIVIPGADSRPDERPIYTSALSRPANPNPLPPLSGKPLTSDSLTALKGTVGSEALVERIKLQHPEYFEPAPFVKYKTLSAGTLALAQEVLIDIITFMAGKCLTCDQLEKLLRDLPPGLGDFPVEIVVSLFPCIIDLRHVDRVLWALSYPERAALIKRLGWLNLWNPMNPDGFVELDLSVYEERRIAEHLVRLAVVEPGENWEDENFNDMPGWELPVSWVTEVPYSGHLTMTYTSVSDGCQAVVSERKTMRAQFLIWC